VQLESDKHNYSQCHVYVHTLILLMLTTVHSAISQTALVINLNYQARPPTHHTVKQTAPGTPWQPTL